MSVRIALGASRWRIVRQLLIESVMLSTVGGLLGWWLAKWGARAYELTAFALYHPTATLDVYPWYDFTMDYRVLGYVVAISIGTAVLFGAAPATRLSTLDVTPELQQSRRSATRRGRGTRIADLLVIGQTAIAVVLLAVAGLMIRSLANIYTAGVGVDTANTVAASTELSQARYPTADARIEFYERLAARLEAVPGVESLAIASRLPAAGSMSIRYELADAPGDEPHPTLSALVVGAGYFRTLGAAVMSGREFTNADAFSGMPVAVVNQRFADEHWHGENPLGQRLRLFEGTAPDPWLTVVGVVSNIVQNDATRQEFSPLIYLPYKQRPEASMFTIARTRVPPDGLAAVFRRVMRQLDPDLPMFDFRTLGPHLQGSYWFNNAIPFLVFAAIALLLASVGLYAVVAHSVGQRTQEIGVRMAVGATAPDILGLIFRQGMRPLGIGVAVGLGVSCAFNRVLTSELVHVSPADPMTLALASTVLVAAGMLGCWIPGRRATRVDPVVAEARLARIRVDVRL
jgi:predicted permease